MSNLKFEFAGTFYAVPYLPKKEWGDWMIRDCRCPLAKFCKRECYLDNASCVYGLGNWEARKAFYYRCFYEEAPQEKPSCENCKNCSSKDSTDSEMIEVSEFDWYTQWKYSPREDNYYYLVDSRKNQARKLKTGKIVNELPSDVVCVRRVDILGGELVGKKISKAGTSEIVTILGADNRKGYVWLPDGKCFLSDLYRLYTELDGKPICSFQNVTM